MIYYMQGLLDDGLQQIRSSVEQGNPNFITNRIAVFSDEVEKLLRELQNLLWVQKLHRNYFACMQLANSNLWLLQERRWCRLWEEQSLHHWVESSLCKVCVLETLSILIPSLIYLKHAARMVRRIGAPSMQLAAANFLLFWKNNDIMG